MPSLLVDEDTTSLVENDLLEVVLRDGRSPLTPTTTVRISRADFDKMNDTYLRFLTDGTSVIVSELDLVFVRLAEAEVAGRITVEEA